MPGGKRADAEVVAGNYFTCSKQMPDLIFFEQHCYPSITYFILMIFIIVCENTVIVFSLAEVNFQARIPSLALSLSTQPKGV